ncbi:unnamed protein product [Bemisia tabaci]|uniref:Uncharacterized protein n=1 Tax=Bemisia tabaci TaxID=7038 RepID=A0A9P0G3V3_BEMTA|nr:unnamed protein product [Bemisia tabaci]
MRCQFVLTVWILLLCHQAHSAALTARGLPEGSPAEGPLLDDEEYEDEFEPAEDLGNLDSAEAKESKHPPQGEDPTNTGRNDNTNPSTEPEAKQVTDKTSQAEAKETPVTPKPEEKNGSPARPSEEALKTGSQTEASKEPEKKVPENQNGSQPKGTTDDGKPADGTKGLSDEQKQADKNARRSKWKLARDKLTGPKSEIGNQQNAAVNPQGVTQKSEPSPKGGKTLALAEKKPVAVSGSISDLLSVIGKRVNSFSDINKKRLPLQVPQQRRVPKMGAKSLPVAGKSLPVTGKPLPVTAKSIPTKPAPSLGAKSLPSEEPPKRGFYDDDDDDDTFSHRLSPFARRKQAERLAKLYASRNGPSTTPTTRSQKTPSAVPLTSNAGTEEYEKLLARRGRQLDELEEEKEKPKMATKALPERLKSVSGTFEDIASQLDNNIKSVSAVNKDKLRAGKMKARGGPVFNTGARVEEGGGGKMSRRGGPDPCPCYNKYSPVNVVRRTVKRVVRAVKSGTNSLYDVADAGLDKTKDVKDAARNDLVDR